jgi:hypothetical protein
VVIADRAQAATVDRVREVIAAAIAATVAETAVAASKARPKSISINS